MEDPYLLDRLFLVVAILTLCVFNFGCGSAQQQVDIEPVVEAINETRADESMIGWQSMHEHLNSLSQKAGISPLREQKLKDSESEIRIWGSIGLDDES